MVIGKSYFLKHVIFVRTNRFVDLNSQVHINIPLSGYVSLRGQIHIDIHMDGSVGVG